VPRASRGQGRGQDQPRFLEGESLARRLRRLWRLGLRFGTITGDGNTRIAYTSAAAGVSVDLLAGNAHSIAPADGAGIGVDIIGGGVNVLRERDPRSWL
jgi:hypothetical protein